MIKKLKDMTPEYQAALKERVAQGQADIKAGRVHSPQEVHAGIKQTLAKLVEKHAKQVA
ncbi:hypothetical protein [Testudinibacter sp. TR-2022]|uniref:hypothetical protein n=1 Tax=Testudinibacter sp. TR-2022 TaxID=2585029 RepID=UPI00159BE661|nr:hypothetical protein [Testudinibacter sp. TR-2022]